MSRLIQMRQRIKAIETTKKVTHAMRLISMSSHTRLRAKNDPLKQYKKVTKNLFNRIRENTPQWSHPIVEKNHKKTDRHLFVVIGSQKGLCGNFNSALFKFFEQQTTPEMLTKADVITVGKKAHDYIQANTQCTILGHYDFNSLNILSIAHELTDLVIQQSSRYKNAYLFGNEIVSFFVQRPRQRQLIPYIEKIDKKVEQPKTKEEYSWEQSPHSILDFLLEQTIETEIQYRLFESLLAEQAARFVSMDNSTRNANTLLEETQLRYNKLRQANITKEITELTGCL